MSQRLLFSTMLAGVMAISAPAHADPDLGEVVGTIARQILEQQQGAQERALWDGVVANGSAAAYRQYLDTYPQGPNAQTARERLERLTAGSGGGSDAAPVSEADGIFGTATRRAIARWQGDNGLSETGYLTAEQVRTLQQQNRI